MSEQPPSSVNEHLPTAESVHVDQISKAAISIRKGGVGAIEKTPLHKASQAICDITGIDMYFKKDIFLPTGSFKERGARFTMQSLSKAERQNGVIGASAGNHALALAYQGQCLGIPVTVVTPVTAPLAKTQRCKQYGAQVIKHGQNIAEARELADTLVTQQNLTYINGFDDPRVIAGAGTMGLEVLESLDSIDFFVVPIGGGGLIAGLATIVKSMSPEVQVIGVEPAACASWSASRKAKKVVKIEMTHSIADGCAVPRVGDNAFKTADHLIDKIVTVSESQIARAVLRLVESERVVVEGAGALGLAAALVPGLLPQLKGKRVVIPLCGANMDTAILGRCIERGLAAEFRLVRFVVTVEDRSGQMANLMDVLKEVGASVKDIFHERAYIDSSINTVQIICVVETSGREHAEQLRLALLHAGFSVVWMPVMVPGDKENMKYLVGH